MDSFLGIAGRISIGTLILAYLVFSVASVLWSIKMGSAGAHVQATMWAKTIFWHGVFVVGIMVLSVAGSFILLFAHLALRVY